MQFKEIAELIDIIGKSSIEEFEMEQSGVRIRVRKSVFRGPRAAGDAAPAEDPGAGRLAAGAEAAEEPAKESSAHVFKAPIVGTFYLTPKPDAEPFVKVGDRVSKGSVLCIIEAMKIFNQIESDVDGEILKILVENGRPVEYGEPLFEIGAAA